MSRRCRSSMGLAALITIVGTALVLGSFTLFGLIVVMFGSVGFGASGMTWMLIRDGLMEDHP